MFRMFKVAERRYIRVVSCCIATQLVISEVSVLALDGFAGVICPRRLW